MKLIYLLVALVVFTLHLIHAHVAHGQVITVEWGYTPPTDPPVVGFKLYRASLPICSTNDPTATTMDCDVDITTPARYTLTALFADATESGHSAPVLYPSGASTPPQPPGSLPLGELRGPIILRVE